MTVMDNNKTYSFETYAPQILGTEFRHVKILGKFPYVTALVLNGEIAPMHAEIYSTGNLPAGTPNDPRQYDYYRIERMDGSITMLGEAWIDQSSIRLSTSQICTIRIPKASSSDTPLLRTALANAGFSDFEITFGDPPQVIS